MTYSLPRIDRPVGCAARLAYEAADFYGSGATVPVDVIGLRARASRSASLEQPMLWITFEEDPTTDAGQEQSLGTSFIQWLGEAPISVLPSFYAVRFAAAVAAATNSRPHFVTPLQQIEEATLIFSLNVSQAAEVFRVSRPAIYAWREGGAVNSTHRERIALIYEYAQLLRKIDPVPVGEALTWVDATTGLSLFALLSANPLDDVALRRWIETLPQRIKEWWAPSNEIIARNEKDGVRAVPDAWRKEMRRRNAGRHIRSEKIKPI